MKECAWSIEAAYATALPFLREEGRDIDALVCGCDTIAVGAMRAARECGIDLPNELAITGFDDIAMACDLHPSLTTVRVPKELMGQLAVRRLIERIKDPSLPPIIQMLPTSLVVRSSTASPSACGSESAPEM
jgi:DNA-binding LacI/PurR family transcriptional regulator